MNLKEAFQQKIEAQVEVYDAEMERVQAEARKHKAEFNEMRADAAITLDAHLKELDKKREAVEDQLNLIKEASQENWETLKSGVERAAKEFEMTVKEIRDNIETKELK